MIIKDKIKLNSFMVVVVTVIVVTSEEVSSLLLDDNVKSHNLPLRRGDTETRRNAYLK